MKMQSLWHESGKDAEVLFVRECPSHLTCFLTVITSGGEG